MIIPKLNSIRFQSVSVKDYTECLTKFLPQPHDDFVHIFNSSDEVKIQVRSDRTNYISGVVYDDCNNFIQNLTFNAVTDYANYKEKLDCKYFEIQSEQKRYVYFDKGNYYKPDTTEVIGQYYLNGQLPEWAKVGQWVDVHPATSGGFEYLTGEIVETKYVKEIEIHGTMISINAFCFIMNTATISDKTPTNTYMQVEYALFTYDYWEAEIPNNITKRMYINVIEQLKYDDTTISFKSSEYIQFKNDTSEYTKVDWSSTGTYKLLYYGSGIKTFGYFNAIWKDITPKGEYISYQSEQDRTVQLRDTVLSQRGLIINGIPAWCIDNLNVYFSCPLIHVNGIQYQKGEKGSSEGNDMAYWMNFIIPLNKVNLDDVYEYSEDEIITTPL